MNNTPLENGFTIPFEGEEHQGTIVLLPYREDTWREHALPGLSCYHQLIQIISRYEKVYVGIDPHLPQEVFSLYENQNNVIPFKVEYNDAWARDNTLIFLKKDDEIQAIDFGFNAWGGKIDGLYDDWEDDNALGKKLVDFLQIPSISRKDFILEGGSIHTDGEGTLLTTKCCLLSKGRNPQFSQEEIEQELKKSLGMKKVIWIDHGIYQDETNEHIDNMACFLAPGEILLATTSNPTDPQYLYSMAAYDVLKNETDSKGRHFKIHFIEVPTDLTMGSTEAASIVNSFHAKVRNSEDRLAASYVNFYQSKDFVIVPKFNHPLDDNAFQFFKNYYKHKDVYQLESREILLAGGNIHCVTMQIPKGEK